MAREAFEVKLNDLEFALMNNPVREWSQRTLETPLTIGPRGTLSGLRVLEVGCGRGVGVEILAEQMDAAEVIGLVADCGGWIDRSRPTRSSI